MLEFSKMTSRGQITIPKRIREITDLHEGDALGFDYHDGKLTLFKLPVHKDEYLQGASDLMDEWLSPEDEKAWRDL